MYCNYCRSLNPDDAVYCSACGRTIKLSAEKTKQPVQSSQHFDLPSDEKTLSAKEHQESQNLQPPTPTIIVPPSTNELQDLGGYKWDLEKMTDEELEQLRESYEKLRVKPSQAVQRELEKRSRKTDLTGKGDRLPPDSQVERFQHSKTETSFAPSVPTLEPKPGGQSTDNTKKASLPSPESKPSLEFKEYAKLGPRFTAYFADVIVIYFILIGFYFVTALLKLPLTAEEDEVTLVWICALFVYMIVAQTAYHTTIGKYVHGLEVCSAKPNRKYPAFWRILLRETFGRLFSSFFWGLGYWMALKKPKTQAWSDELAGTVVTVRQTNRVLVRAFTAFILVAFILDVGAIGYGQYKKDKDKKYAELQQEMDAAGNAVIAARKDVDNKLSSAPTLNTWADFRVWQGMMKSFRNDVDVYEGRIDHVQELIQRGISENLAASEAERRQLVTFRQVYDLRKQQAKKLRQEANLVISCEPTQSSYAALQNDLQLLDSDIKSLDHKASQLLTEINTK